MCGFHAVHVRWHAVSMTYSCYAREKSLHFGRTNQYSLSVQGIPYHLVRSHQQRDATFRKRRLTLPQFAYLKRAVLRPMFVVFLSCNLVGFVSLCHPFVCFVVVCSLFVFVRSSLAKRTARECADPPKEARFWPSKRFEGLVWRLSMSIVVRDVCVSSRSEANAMLFRHVISALDSS